MGFKLSYLYTRPDVNPVTLKARSIPLLNPVDIYGRVFFFSWFGFMIAFWAWYTFPPLVANSNIVSLCATLLVRLVAGPLCDKFGPRNVFGGLLLVGSIPLGLAPLVHNARGLYVSRFFIGILGGSFVPCQVWSTGFFDKNVIGTANALTGGLGNAGGGITYFIMPAVYDALAGAGYLPGQAWRLTFLVPLSMVITTGIALILLCPDTPTGRWRDRHLHCQRDGPLDLDKANSIVYVPGRITDRPDPSDTFQKSPAVAVAITIPIAGVEPPNNNNNNSNQPGATAPPSYPSIPSTERLPTKTTIATTTTAAGVAGAAATETVQPPTARELVRVALSPQAAFHALAYLCSFGTELAVNGVLAAYYAERFPRLSQTEAAGWAAAFGFLNVASRPLGGAISDLLYRRFSSPPSALWWKKGWVVACGVIAGLLLILIGALNPGGEGAMFGLVAIMALFLEAGNGANFSLVPHVHPQANGVLSGLTGAAGNLGGVLFAVVFRCMDGGTNYAKGFWIIGVVNLAVNLGVCWIPPLPKGQVGGR
ncbi:major facilitator superfamily domain-containing protein [Thermothelomyces heterothallicus CBS 202.75]|uniref:major facilitator superfamily domain-containing protein n=1 Tax=Thermothelomyces heterothallicus CBS 202.75 TaxID=1149848 RepID=UPI0037443702